MKWFALACLALNAWFSIWTSYLSLKLRKANELLTRHAEWVMCRYCFKRFWSTPGDDSDYEFALKRRLSHEMNRHGHGSGGTLR